MVKGLPLWGFLLLCVLSGNGWVLTQAWPSEIRWPFSACIHFGLIGLVGLCVATARREWTASTVWRVLNLGGVGLCLFVVPTAAVEIGAGRVSEATSAAEFCVVPLMTVLASGLLGSEDPRVRGLMVPALAGLAGAALLFPASVPGTLRAWLFAGLVTGACVVVAVASVEMHSLMRGAGVAVAVTIVGLGSSAVLGLYGLAAGWPILRVKTVAEEMLRCAALDLPEVWLLVWLIRQVAPSRLAARFLFVPLMTVMAGYAVERRELEWRVVLAAGLLGGGGVMLLFRDEPEEIPGLQLR